MSVAPASRPTPTCDYCGLPARNASPESAGPHYCCLGCQLADSITSDSSQSDAVSSRTAFRLGLAVFFTMNVMVFTMALWSWDTYSIATSENAAILKELLRLACLMFATPVVLILGKPLLISVAGQLRNRVVTADLLLVLGVAAAYAYSVVSVATGQAHIYFEVACMILVAVTLGRWVEAEGKHRAMKSLQSLQSLLPDTARVIGDDGTLNLQPLNDVVVGQMVRVLPGERIPLDGLIHTGQSYVNQQLVTGESQAACRSAGDSVFGGTANLDGRLDIQVIADAASGVIQRIVDSVQAAASQSSRPQRLADRLATVFVPLVFVIVVLVFIAHWQTSGMHHALMSSMAVALIACPCALAIATPLAVWAALATAAKHGLVFRTSDDLTTLAEVDRVCIDKTGTVTTDDPHLAGSWYVANAEREAQSIARQLAAETRHPLANGLQRQLPRVEFEPNHITIGPATTRAGRGVSASFVREATGSSAEPSTACLGSLAFCEEMGLNIPHELRRACNRASSQAQSVVCVGWESQVRGVFAFDETLRPGAVAAVQALGRLGLPTVLLTGDLPARATRLADKLGLDAAAQLLPGDKQSVITSLQADGHQVAMVGDGINDAPALSQANVGIALGCGADVTRDAADVCLLSSRLELLPWSIELARKTRNTIRRNLLWAVVYNAVGIALAAAGRLNPILAAVAMILSSGFVIGESLRLATFAGPASSADNSGMPNSAAQNETPPRSDLLIGASSP